MRVSRRLWVTLRSLYNEANYRLVDVFQLMHLLMRLARAGLQGDSALRFRLYVLVALMGQVRMRSEREIERTL